MHKLLEVVDWAVRVDPTGKVVGWRQSWTLLLLYYSPSRSNPELWVGWPSTIAERNALGVPGPIFLSPPIGGPQSEARWKATWLQHSLAYLTRTYTNGFFFLRIKLPILLVYPDLCHWQVHYDEVLVHVRCCSDHWSFRAKKAINISKCWVHVCKMPIWNRRSILDKQAYTDGPPKKTLVPMALQWIEHIEWSHHHRTTFSVTTGTCGEESK